MDVAHFSGKLFRTAILVAQLVAAAVLVTLAAVSVWNVRTLKKDPVEETHVLFKNLQSENLRITRFFHRRFDGSLFLAGLLHGLLG